jgi:hypothetical protein
MRACRDQDYLPVDPLAMFVDHELLAFTTAKLKIGASESDPAVRFSTQILKLPLATPLIQ